jgi:hypothetical protein
MRECFICLRHAMNVIAFLNRATPKIGGVIHPRFSIGLRSAFSDAPKGLTLILPVLPREPSDTAAPNG